MSASSSKIESIVRESKFGAMDDEDMEVFKDSKVTARFGFPDEPEEDAWSLVEDDAQVLDFTREQIGFLADYVILMKEDRINEIRTQPRLILQLAAILDFIAEKRNKVLVIYYIHYKDNQYSVKLSKDSASFLQSFLVDRKQEPLKDAFDVNDLNCLRIALINKTQTNIIKTLRTFDTFSTELIEAVLQGLEIKKSEIITSPIPLSATVQLKLPTSEKIKLTEILSQTKLSISENESNNKSLLEFLRLKQRETINITPRSSAEEMNHCKSLQRVIDLCKLDLKKPSNQIALKEYLDQLKILITKSNWLNELQEVAKNIEFLLFLISCNFTENKKGIAVSVPFSKLEFKHTKEKILPEEYQKHFTFHTTKDDQLFITIAPENYKKIRSKYIFLPELIKTETPDIKPKKTSVSKIKAKTTLPTHNLDAKPLFPTPPTKKINSDNPPKKHYTPPPG